MWEFAGAGEDSRVAQQWLSLPQALGWPVSDVLPAWTLLFANGWVQSSERQVARMRGLIEHWEMEAGGRATLAEPLAEACPAYRQWSALRQRVEHLERSWPTTNSRVTARF